MKSTIGRLITQAGTAAKVRLLQNSDKAGLPPQRRCACVRFIAVGYVLQGRTTMRPYPSGILATLSS